MTIQEANKLIAEFMDIEQLDVYQCNKKIWFRAWRHETFTGAYWVDVGSEGFLKYHISWDWLMPVVQKIFKTDTFTTKVYTLYVSDSLRSATIENVLNAVIDFIQWYNSQNNDK